MTAKEQREDRPKATATAEAAGHVVYEWATLQGVAVTLDRLDGPGGVVYDALIESFLLHVRNLYQFFVTDEDSKRFSDDYTADLFLQDREAVQRVRARAKQMSEQSEWINKRLAHLSASRIDLSKKWNLNRLHACLSAAWDEFLSSLSPERRGWFSGDELESLRQQASNLSRISEVETSVTRSHYGRIERSSQCVQHG